MPSSFFDKFAPNENQDGDTKNSILGNLGADVSSNSTGAGVSGDNTDTDTTGVNNPQVSNKTPSDFNISIDKNTIGSGNGSYSPREIMCLLENSRRNNNNPEKQMDNIKTRAEMLNNIEPNAGNYFVVYLFTICKIPIVLLVYLVICPIYTILRRVDSVIDGFARFIPFVKSPNIAGGFANIINTLLTGLENTFLGIVKFETVEEYCTMNVLDPSSLIDRPIPSSPVANSDTQTDLCNVSVPVNTYNDILRQIDGDPQLNSQIFCIKNELMVLQEQRDRLQEQVNRGRSDPNFDTAIRDQKLLNDEVDRYNKSIAETNNFLYKTLQSIRFTASTFKCWYNLLYVIILSQFIDNEGIFTRLSNDGSPLADHERTRLFCATLKRYMRDVVNYIVFAINTFSEQEEIEKIDRIFDLSVLSSNGVDVISTIVSNILSHLQGGVSDVKQEVNKFILRGGVELYSDKIAENQTLLDNEQNKLNELIEKIPNISRLADVYNRIKKGENLRDKLSGLVTFIGGNSFRNENGDIFTLDANIHDFNVINNGIRIYRKNIALYTTLRNRVSAFSQCVVTNDVRNTVARFLDDIVNPFELLINDLRQIFDRNILNLRSKITRIIRNRLNSTTVFLISRSNNLIDIIIDGICEEVIKNNAVNDILSSDSITEDHFNVFMSQHNDAINTMNNEYQSALTSFGITEIGGYGDGDTSGYINDFFSQLFNTTVNNTRSGSLNT